MKKGITLHKHHISFGLIILILLIVVILITIKPAMTYYKLKGDFKEMGVNADSILKQIDLLKSEKLIDKTDLKNCKEINEDSVKQINEGKNKTFECLSQKVDLESEIEQMQKEYEFNLTKIKTECEQTKSSAQIELEQIQMEYDNLINEFNDVVESSANNICCKNKVDNSEIDSYSISNGKIVCLSGGENKISCK